MSETIVFHTQIDANKGGKESAVNRLLAALKAEKMVKPRDFVAIKVHIGEVGCKTFISPDFIAEAVSFIRSKDAIPFITDTAVLYRSNRSNAPEHIVLAHQHGFDYEGVGAPFFPADGLLGTQEINVPISGNYYNEVPVAAVALEATTLFIFSHVTGHLGAGMGATLKNIGMGFSSRKGKLSQHSSIKPEIREDRCTDCEECIEWCPENAISDPEGFAVINQELCIGCGQCLAVCRFDAVKFNWGVSSYELQERMVEHALAIVKKKKGRLIFFNILVNITKDCDCLGDAGQPVLPDLGIIASTDPVAIDQAALDIIQKASGHSLCHFAYPNIKGNHQIEYAEKLGLGTKDYNLVYV